MCPATSSAVRKQRHGPGLQSRQAGRSVHADGAHASSGLSSVAVLSRGSRLCSQGGEDWQLAQHQAGRADAGQRAAAAQVQGTSLQQARARLALTAVPLTLPCRERERDQIRAFVEGCVTAGGPLLQAPTRLVGTVPICSGLLNICC